MPNPALAGGSGFLQGFSSVLTHALNERTREKARQDSLLGDSVLQMMMKNPETATNPAAAKILEEHFGKDETQRLLDFMPIIAQANQAQEAAALSHFGGGGAAAGAAPAAVQPSAAPTSMTENAPSLMTPTPSAPPPTPSRGLGPGQSISYKTRGGLRLSESGPSKTEADTGEFQQTVKAYEDKLTEMSGGTLKAEQLTPMAYRMAADQFQRSGRIVPERALKIAEAPMTRQQERLLSAEKTAGRIEGEQATQTIGGAKEGGLWFYPEGHGRAGQPLPSNLTLGRAQELGGVRVTSKAADQAAGLAGSTEWLQQLESASKFVNTEDTRVSQVAKGVAMRTQKRFVGGGKGTAALQVLDNSRATILSYLRNAFGEKGNIAARIVEASQPLTIDEHDTKTESRAKVAFMGGVLAATKKATGVPLKEDEKKFFSRLDPTIRENIVAALGGGGEEAAPEAGVGADEGLTPEQIFRKKRGIGSSGG